eukprot:scaffold7133_cov66-Phaeocystis_antarctica.AAC.3
MGVVETRESAGVHILLGRWLSNDGGGCWLGTLGTLFFGVRRPEPVLFTLAEVGRLRPRAQGIIALAGPLVKVVQRAARRSAPAALAHFGAGARRSERRQTYGTRLDKIIITDN